MFSGGRNLCAVLGVHSGRGNIALGVDAAHLDTEERAARPNVILRQHAERPHRKPILERHRRGGLAAAAQFALVGRLCA